MAEVFWNRMRAAELVELAQRDAIVLLPVAATEQHGPHLPTGTDTFLCEEACRRTAELVQAAGKPAVVAPTLWMGLSEHHVAYGGTFTVGLATWHALLRELCQAILRAGFKRILIVNGHGGNVAALNALTVDLTRETGAPIATTTYAAFARKEVAGILEDQEGVMHACEAETSMVMALRPELVAEDRLSDAVGPNASRDEALARPLHRWKSFRDMTPSGVFGDARRANAEKGERLLAAFVSDLAARLVAGEPWG